VHCAGSINKRIMVQAYPSINAKPYLKNKQCKKGKHLCSKCEALSSSPSTMGGGKEEYASLHITLKFLQITLKIKVSFNNVFYFIEPKYYHFNVEPILYKNL
jgi:hypothetical protein